MRHMTLNEQAPEPSPAYHRAHVRLGPALHLDVLTLVSTLYLLTLYRLASATYTVTIIVSLAAQHAGRS